MTEKQNAELLADIVKDCREAAKIRRQQNFHPLSARDVAGIYERLADSIERAAAPSPHSRGEEIAKIIGGDIFGSPDSSVGPATVSARQNALTKADAILALFAAPPPAGADAVRIQTIEQEASVLWNLMLIEREAGHTQGTWTIIRDCVLRLRSVLPAPQPQEKPTTRKDHHD